MKAYFTGFWSGFHERTNAVHEAFFLDLLSLVFEERVEVGDFEESCILVENTQVESSVRLAKTWKKTFLYSGESYIRSDCDDYDCVLYGKRTARNLINCPQYVSYLYCRLGTQHAGPVFERAALSSVPKKDVLTIISNPQGATRNHFIEALEARGIDVTHAGNYKNNTGGPLKAEYNTDEFLRYVGQFKFMLCMENSECETYITEKICHGLLAGIVPIYWGSPRVADYFSESRFLAVNSSNFEGALKYVKEVDDASWLTRVRSRAFTDFGETFTIDEIARQIRNLFTPAYPQIRQIYMICSRDFEPKRYDDLQQMCDNLGWRDDAVRMMCPTYHHLIDSDTYQEYTSEDRALRLRSKRLTRAELSLYFNYRSVLEDIEKRYGDGMFLCFESDVFASPNISEFPRCLESLANCADQWSCVHVGGDPTDALDDYAPYYNQPYRDNMQDFEASRNAVLANPILECKGVRFFRHLNPRCTDSLAWTHAGVVRFLSSLRATKDYSAPLDYFLGKVCESDLNFMHYWSEPSYFRQKSNLGLVESTMQR